MDDDDLAPAIDKALDADGVALLEPMDARRSLALARGLGATATMLDPWYNKGVGGTLPRAEYDDLIAGLLRATVTPHVYLWGFPEVVARYVDDHPNDLALTAWLTWYYKNNPSVIRGWRSAQMTCLHFTRTGATLHPEHFLNDAQRAKQAAGKLRYLPGPTSVLDEADHPSDVIESALLVGFVGRDEQTGHPSQKPVRVYERLVLMASQPGDVIIDPMAGSGTTGVVARLTGRRAILADADPGYVELMEGRLGIRRIQARR